MLIITVWNGPLVKLLYLSRYLFVCIRDRVQVLVQILDLIWTQRNLMLTQWSRCPGEVEVGGREGGGWGGGHVFQPGLRLSVWSPHNDWLLILSGGRAVVSWEHVQVAGCCFALVSGGKVRIVFCFVSEIHQRSQSRLQVSGISG